MLKKRVSVVGRQNNSPAAFGLLILTTGCSPGCNPELGVGSQDLKPIELFHLKVSNANVVSYTV